MLARRLNNVAALRNITNGAKQRRRREVFLIMFFGSRQFIIESQLISDNFGVIGLKVRHKGADNRYVDNWFRQHGSSAVCASLTVKFAKINPAKAAA